MFTKHIYSSAFFFYQDFFAAFPTPPSLPGRRVYAFDRQGKRGRGRVGIPERQQGVSSVTRRHRRRWPRVAVFINLPVFEYSSILGLELHAGTSAARALSVRWLSHPCT